MNVLSIQPLQDICDNGQKELQGAHILNAAPQLRPTLTLPQGKNRRGGGGGRGGGNQDRGGWRDYPAIPKENEKLQRFYDTLLQLPEEEKNAYWEALRRELPNSFRFCGSKGYVLSQSLA